MAVTSQRNHTQPTLDRKGISWDARARQFTCRVGYRLNDRGERARDFQYLTGDADEATVRHINLVREWDATCSKWPEWVSILPAILTPDQIKVAGTAKPFWIKPEWREAAQHLTDRARATVEHSQRSTRLTLAKMNLSQIDHAKETISRLAADAGHMQQFPADVRARALQALQPAANEVRGVAADAQRLTIRQAATAYLAYKAGKIGLKMKGRKSGGGIGDVTYNHVKRMVDDALKLLPDEDADLNDLTHEKLEAFVDAAYRKAKAPRTAYNWCKQGLKPLLDWCHRQSSIDYRNTDTIDEIFSLSKPDASKKSSYTADVIAKLRMIRAVAEAKTAGETWVFVLLGLNCGTYQADIAALTYENLRVAEEGTVALWWQRSKTKHQNTDLWTKHVLWPETWQRMQAHMAPDDVKVNPGRRLFMSESGREMYRVAKGAARMDVIGLRYKRVIDKCKNEDGTPAEIDLSFKQLRKIGLNAVKKASGGSDDVARMYAGQAVPGVLKCYLEDDFTDLSAALTKWGEQLRADKVL
jgi:hypothetical protein